MEHMLKRFWQYIVPLRVCMFAGVAAIVAYNYDRELKARRRAMLKSRRESK